MEARKYVLRFPNGDHEIIESFDSGSLSVEHILCPNEYLEFGGCNASKFTGRALLDDDITGLKVELVGSYTDEDSEVEFVGYVDECTRSDDGIIRDIVAYDELYRYRTLDISEWYANYFETTPTSTILEFRTALCSELGLEMSACNLVNDNLIITKTVTGGKLFASDVLKAIAQLNGAFIVGYHGIIEFLTISKTAVPMAIRASESRLESYIVDSITKVSIKEDDDDIGASYGTDGNIYSIVGNILTYGMSLETKQAAAQAILSEISGIAYTPGTITALIPSNMRLGSRLSFSFEESEEYALPMLNVRYSGPQLVDMEISAPGSQNYNNVDMAGSEVKKLKAKMLKIDKTIDGIHLEASEASKTAGEAKAQVGLNSHEIVLKVTNDGKIAACMLSSVPEEGTVIEISADNVRFTAEQIIDMLSGGTINLTGKNIKIASDNFTVSESGRVTANSGSIAGWNLSPKSFYVKGSDNLYTVILKKDENNDVAIACGSQYYQSAHPSSTLRIYHSGKINMQKPNTQTHTLSDEESVTIDSGTIRQRGLYEDEESGWRGITDIKNGFVQVGYEDQRTKDIIQESSVMIAPGVIIVKQVSSIETGFAIDANTSEIYTSFPTVCDTDGAEGAVTSTSRNYVSGRKVYNSTLKSTAITATKGASLNGSGGWIACRRVGNTVQVSFALSVSTAIAKATQRNMATGLPKALMNIRTFVHTSTGTPVKVGIDSGAGILYIASDNQTALAVGNLVVGTLTYITE